MSILTIISDITIRGSPITGTMNSQKGRPATTISQTRQLAVVSTRGRRPQNQLARVNSSFSLEYSRRFNLSSNRAGDNSSYFHFCSFCRSCQTLAKRLLNRSFIQPLQKKSTIQVSGFLFRGREKREVISDW